MTPERWKQIDELAQSALERAGGERASFLDEACGGDDALRREVESQIAYQQQASKFLEEPAFKHAAASMADPQPETESMEGRTISHYGILRKLGSGGMGEVYLAQDTTLSRKVAIKFLSQDSFAGEQAKKRLVREAKAAAALDHPHICGVYEVGEEAGFSFIVMQYVEGETLACRIQQKTIDVREALDIAVQIADALAEAHSHRIIHRDVKPQNVMLTASGQVKVLDFGLARVVREGSLIDTIGETESLLTAPGSVVGTVPYMSPEQVRGEALDARSDIFSFGAVLYEMLSGRQPFQGESVGATMSSILTKEPAPLARYASDVPDELQRLVRKSLSKDKEGRYQGIKDLLIDLRDLKEELEFEAKLERSTGQEARDEATANERESAGVRAEAETAPQQTVRTGESFTPRTTSSTRVVIGEIKRHKLWVSIALAALAIVAVAAYFYFNRKPVLTDKDTILLTEFENKTGEDVFDGTLKQGLAVQLQQSPFLDIFADTRVRQTLGLMSRSQDEKVTRDIGREICQRQGLKAYIVGSIAKFDRNYSITLEALNGQTGEPLALTLVQAQGKDDVLDALSRAATGLREKLGESLSSIQKFDLPLQVTTSSLEALHEYALGKDAQINEQRLKAIEFLRHATEKDPNFASAWSVLAVTYKNNGQPGLAAECETKAYELRDRASEDERARITFFHYCLVTGELDKAIEVGEANVRNYPRDARGPNNLAVIYGQIGQAEQALAGTREALRQSPSAPLAHSNLAGSLIRLNRFAEAKEVLQRALAQKLDATGFHRHLHTLAFINGDTPAMQEQIIWASGKPDEHQALTWQTNTAAFAGEWRKSQEFLRRATELALRNGAKENAANYTAVQAGRAAWTGQSAQAVKLAEAALKIERQNVLESAALALALAGEAAKTQSLIAELEQKYPKDTLVNQIGLPEIKAALELRKGNAANAQSALDLLESTRRFEPADGFWPQTLRAMAYLKLGKGAEAAAECRKILDHRGEGPLSLLWPLAHLNLARASALQGDTTQARKSYQDFFALWKDADADLPILIEAKKEYQKIK